MPVHYVHQADAGIDIGDHVFPTGKYRELARLVREELGVPSKRFHGWEEVLDEDLERVHTPHYLDDLRHARTSWATSSSELPVNAQVIEGFRLMSGGSIRAVRLALEHGVGFHIGGGFHHAFPDHGEGFCYLHDMGIAVERMRADEGIDRVLFVDVDVHQGNGTVAVYRDDPDTFTYSIHQRDNYPLKQNGDLDRGLEDGIGDAEYLERLTADLDSIDEHFEPDLVCYVAGVDPHHDDVLGGLGLSDDGIRQRDEMVLGRYIGRSIPVAVFLAGGYAPSPEQTAGLHLHAARACEAALQRAADPS
ncbi:histone deacetylase [bacterium]|nr:MAG: histone deacetylase [bacterium]